MRVRPLSGYHSLTFSNYTVLKEEYLKEAQKVISDPNVLINIVSKRAKQLKNGMSPLVESLEKLLPEEVALKEIIEGKITYKLYDPSEDEQL